MQEKCRIKQLYEIEGKNLLEISKETGFNYRTVRKYAYQEDWNEKENCREKNPSKLEKYIPTINEWLEKDRKVPRKQRHTTKRIHSRLCEEKGFTGSYSIVQKYVRGKKNEIEKHFLPLEHPAGEGQVDFGEFHYYDAESKEEKGYFLAISFPYSNKGYVQAFQGQNQECLLEGMKKIFEYVGGVPTKLRFDNMSTAVAQIKKGGERVLTDGFKRFMLHYRFEAQFCNPASGNEKGNVENKVGYIRRNAFVPMPTIKSFEEFNEKLLEWCEKDAEREHYVQKIPIEEMWQADKKELLKLPDYPFSVFRYETLVTDKTGFASIDSNKYGLPPIFSGEKVQAKIFCDKVEFFYDHKKIGEFQRQYGKNKEIFDWTRYISLLCKKPRATNYTRFFKKMPQMWQNYLSSSVGQERKSALQLLNEIVNDGNEKLCDDTIILANETGKTDVASLRQCYYFISKREFHPKPLDLSSLPVPDVKFVSSLADYDVLMGGGTRGKD